MRKQSQRGSCGGIDGKMDGPRLFGGSRSKTWEEKMEQKSKDRVCPICKGTGFSKPGEICPHITGKMPEGFDVPDFLKNIFGSLDGRKK